MSEKTIDQAKLNELMDQSWSWRGSGSKAILTEEDKDDLTTPVIDSLGAKIVDGVAVLGKTEVSE